MCPWCVPLVCACRYLALGVTNLVWSNAYDGIPGELQHIGLGQGLARTHGLAILCSSLAGWPCPAAALSIPVSSSLFVWRK